MYYTEIRNFFFQKVCRNKLDKIFFLIFVKYNITRKENLFFQSTKCSLRA